MSMNSVVGQHVASLRSDGQVVLAGPNKSKTANAAVWKVPSLKKGYRFTDVVASYSGTFFQSEKIPSGTRVATSIVKVTKPKTVKRGKKTTVKVKVFSMAVTKGGTVRIKHKGKTIGKAKVGAGAVAKVKINTKHFKKSGKNTITIKYLGKGKGKGKASYSVKTTIRTK